MLIICVALPICLGGLDASAASPLALSCMGCHLAAVDSPPMPSLAHMPRAAIVASLRRARDAPDVGSIMTRFVATLSDSDIDALANELGAHAR